MPLIHGEAPIFIPRTGRLSSKGSNSTTKKDELRETSPSPRRNLRPHLHHRTALITSGRAPSQRRKDLRHEFHEWYESIRNL